MNILKKLVNCIKNIFVKEDKIKEIEAPMKSETIQNKFGFINSLKVTTSKEKKKKKIETLICEGDGLGIQKKINY